MVDEPGVGAMQRVAVTAVDVVGKVGKAGKVEEPRRTARAVEDMMTLQRIRQTTWRNRTTTGSSQPRAMGTNGENEEVRRDGSGRENWTKKR